MKILITGVTGFLGRSLQEFYDHKKHDICLVYRGFNLTNTLNSYKPDLILHCAGEIYKPDLMYRTNIGMVEEILEWVRRNPAARMIQIGSSSEYGTVKRATRETDAIAPVDVYSATKGAATLLCQGYSRQFDLQVAVARIYSGYGAHERSHRLFPRLYRAFFQDEPMTLFDGVHDFIYIDDFLRGIDLLVNAERWPSGEIVNFGSGTQYRNITVLKLWENITGRTAPVEYINRFSKPFETDFWQCDTTYAKQQYGFVTEYSLEQGIEDFIKKMEVK